MWSYSFTVFLSAFQLLPTAPFHILALGGSQHRSRAVPRLPHLCLGDLGADHRRHRRSLRQAPRPDRREPGDHGVLAALCDRAVVPGDPGAGAGPRRVLVGPAVELELLHASTSCRSRAAPKAWATRVLPASSASRWRRGSACGCSITAAGGCCVSRRPALNLIMALIAWRLPPDTPSCAPARSMHPTDLVEWRILIGAVTLFLYSFSYGGITSFVAVYAEQLGVPRGAVFHGLLPDDRRDAAVHRPLRRSRRPRARRSCRAWR